MKRDNLVLIGMPGAGKSTVGVVAAKILGYNFVDSDIVIQDKEKRLLKDIIDNDGIDGFIEIEERVNAQIDVHNSVIATGGSVVYGAKAMEHLKAIGTVVYIKASYEEIEKRLGDLHQRGVVLKRNQDLKALYDERCPLYEKYADITIESDSMELKECAAAIVDLYLGQNCGIY